MILGTGALRNILGNTYPVVVMLLCLCANSFALENCPITQRPTCSISSKCIPGSCWHSGSIFGTGCGNLTTCKSYHCYQGCIPRWKVTGDCYTLAGLDCSDGSSPNLNADSLNCISDGGIYQDGQCVFESSSSSSTTKDSVKVCANETTCDIGSGCYTQMGLFKCSGDYKSLTECEPLMLVPGTCSQNGYETGEQPPDSVDYGADCFASFDGTCFMMDKQTGNQFQCDCVDNLCNDAYNQMSLGNCKNPYASSASSSPSSSASSSASQSSASSSPSSSADRPPDSVDSPKFDSGGVWNYDYSGILNAINNNVISVDNSVNNGFGQVHNDLTQMQTTAGQQLMQEEFIRANTQQIASNTDYTNTLIKQSDANRKAENGALIAKYNQMIGEVESINETLNQDVSLPDTSNYPHNWNVNPDTISGDAEAEQAISRNDSLLGNARRSLDSLQAVMDSIRDPNRHDTIGLDQIYDFSDTNEIRQKLSDFFFPGQVSNSCPVLDHTIHWPEPFGDQRWYVDFGNLLGKFDICAFTRWIVRLFTTIAIIFGSFKAVMRAFGGGG